MPISQYKISKGRIVEWMLAAAIFIGGALLFIVPKYVNINAYCATALLLLLWGALTWHVWQTEISNPPMPTEDQALDDDTTSLKPN